MSDLIQGIYTDGSGVSILTPIAVDVSGKLLAVSQVTKPISSVTNQSVSGEGDFLITPDANRIYFEIQNNSIRYLWLNFGSTALSNTGLRLPPESSWSSPYGFNVAQSISIWGDTAGQEFAYITG